VFQGKVIPSAGRLAAIAVGAAALAGAISFGVVMAQGSGGSGSSDHQAARQAYIDQLAQQLGIDSSKLTDAVRATDLAQIQQYLKDGKITQAEADALTQRINAAATPPFGVPAHPHARQFFQVGGVGDLGDVAQFLNTDTTTIKDALKGGQSLAQVAQAHGKTADELKTFLTDKATQRIKDAVADGKITQAQADTITSNLSSRLDKIINATHDRMHSATPGTTPDSGGSSSSYQQESQSLSNAA
jgi:polyhydroxyalkanoate synthesis regulator phasin